MEIIKKAAFILPIAIGMGLAGCASPNIVITPNLSAPTTQQASEILGSVQLVMEGADVSPQLSRYEERGERTQIGRSESLGVHLSDFWVEEPPAAIVKRMLENILKTWGYQAMTNQQPVQLHGHVNKLSLNSKAISLVEFQADGVIDVDLNVVRGGIQTYKENYVGTCTFKSATQIPNKDNMEKLFNSCVAEFQKRLDEDNMLRAALSSH